MIPTPCSAAELEADRAEERAALLRLVRQQLPEQLRHAAFAAFDPDPDREALELTQQWVGAVERWSVAGKSGDGPNILLTSFRKGEEVAPGNGKCLGRGTLVLMLDGTAKPVESVCRGDVLLGPDSLPRRVLTTTRGVGPLYRVVPNKGVPFVVNDQHILSLRISGSEEIRNVPVREYLSGNKELRVRGKCWRPEGVYFGAHAVPLDPYFLGVWLGDGTSSEAAVTTPDPEIHEFLHAFARSEGVDLVPTAAAGLAITFRLRQMGVRGRENPVTRKLRDLNVLNNKHVPHSYLANDRGVRLQILAGLLDSDGNLNPPSGFEFSTKRIAIRDGVLFLARSLGLAAYTAEKVVGGEVYHRICISGFVENVPTRIKRKQAPPRKQIKNVLNTGVRTVEALGDGEFFGFELAGPDGLFLLGDFTVTHNSFLAAAGLLELAGRSVGRVYHFERGGETWPSLMWKSSADLIAEVRSTYNRNSDTTAEQVVSRYVWADVLVLDDIGTEPGAEDATSHLFRLMDHRIGKPTFYTSNYSPRKLSERSPEWAKIVSRMSASLRGTSLSGPDRRKPSSPADAWGRWT